MTRRYLSKQEAESNLNRGKSIECFIGACGTKEKPGIEWLSISKIGEEIVISIYESADLGDEDYCDIYGFGPLDEDLEYEDANETFNAASLEQALDILTKRYSNCKLNLVNQFLVQDEYIDFVKRGRL